MIGLTLTFTDGQTLNLHAYAWRIDKDMESLVVHLDRDNRADRFYAPLCSLRWWRLNPTEREYNSDHDNGSNREDHDNG